MKEEREEITVKQVFTEDQLERMAKELIIKALGTTAPSLSQMEQFINTLIENKGAMKSFVKLTEKIVKEEYLLVKFDEKTIKN